MVDNTSSNLDLVVRFAGIPVPFYFNSENDNFEGHLTTILDMFMRKHKFKYKIYMKNYLDYGKVDEHGNGTGLVGDLMKNEADISILPMTPNHQNFAHLDFTTPVQVRDWKIVAAAPKEYHSHVFEVFMTFPLEVWFCVILFGLWFLLSWIGMHHWLRKNGFRRKTVNTSRLPFFQMGVLLRQSIRIPSFLADRLLWVTWIVGSLILSMTFTNNILSTLAVPDTIKILETFKDVLDYRSVKFYVIKNTPPAYYIERSQDPIVQEVWDIIVRENNFVIIGQTDMFDIFERTKQGLASCLLSEEIILEALFKYAFCETGKNLQMPSKSAVVNTYSFAMRKGLETAISSSFKKLASSVFESGVYEHSIDLGSFMGRQCFSEPPKDQAKVWDPLKYHHFIAFFYLLTCGSIFSVVAVCGEVVLWSRAVNKSKYLKTMSQKPVRTVLKVRPVRSYKNNSYNLLIQKIFNFEIIYDSKR